MNTIQCAVRKISVPALPEEIVRQNLLSQMLSTLGYPSGLIVVEKDLHQLPHLTLSKSKPPDRRADILCYGPDIHPDHSLYPLLLIECKAVAITPKVVSQVAGYNHFVKSYFICLANHKEIRTGWWNSADNSYQFVPFLPTYQELRKCVLQFKNVE